LGQKGPCQTCERGEMEERHLWEIISS
jgi:hypothetical protein